MSRPWELPAGELSVHFVVITSPDKDDGYRIVVKQIDYAELTDISAPVVIPLELGGIIRLRVVEQAEDLLYDLPVLLCL